VIVCVNFFWKHSSRLLYSSRSISSSFLVRFEWFKTRWVHQLGLYETSMYSPEAKMQRSKISSSKSKSVLIHSPPTTKPSPLHQTLRIFLIHLSNWVIFAELEALGEGLQIFFDLQKKRKNMWGFELLWVLKFSLTGIPNCPLLPEWTPVYYEQRYCPILGFRV